MAIFQMKTKTDVSPWLKMVFGLDLRSLALFRVSMGCVLLWDLLQRWMDRSALYSDEGVLDADGALSIALDGQWSLHVLSDAFLYQQCLWLLAVGSAVMLVIGYRTRWATLLSWLLLLSLHVRNPYVLIGGDVLMRLLLFWGLFLPLGAKASLDSRRLSTQTDRPHQVASMASAAFLLQLMAMYVFTALLKTGPEWHGEANAVELAVHIDNFGTHLGAWLGQYPALAAFLTRFTYGLELFGPLLLFSPIAPGLMRFVLTATFILFHVGHALCLELGFFPIICIAAWTACLPHWFWERPFAQAVSSFLCRHFPLKAHENTENEAESDGPKSQCRPKLLQRLRSGGLFALLLVVFAWNLGTLIRTRDHIPRPLRFATRALGLDQAWRMFAPSPARLDGWIVVGGLDQRERQIDVYREGQPSSFERPKRVSVAYGSVRWRKFFGHLAAAAQASELAERTAAYYCRFWNQTSSEAEQVSEVSIFHLRQNLGKSSRHRLTKRRCESLSGGASFSRPDD
jgi:hypothetical protein